MQLYFERTEDHNVVLQNANAHKICMNVKEKHTHKICTLLLNIPCNFFSYCNLSSLLIQETELHLIPT